MRKTVTGNSTAFLRLMVCILFLPCFLLMDNSLPQPVYFLSGAAFIYAVILYAFPLALSYLNMFFPMSLILDLLLITSFIYLLEHYTLALALFYLLPVIGASFNERPAAPFGTAFLAGFFYLALAVLRGYWLIPVILQIIYFFIIAFFTATMTRQFQHTYIQQANQDSLTKIHNRRFFNYFLDKQVNTQTPHTLILIDLDNFKQLNDTQGHHHGDYVLKVVASILKEHTRSYDMVARYGGDEFAIILPHTSKDESKNIAERIRNGVLINPKLLLYPIISISLGLASYPDDAQSTEELLEKADAALYRAKAMGKNCVCTCESET